MKTRILWLALPVLLFSLNVHAAPVEWNLDNVHTSVGFSVKHLAISKTNGEFKDFDAKIMADAETGKVTSLTATAKTASIFTGNEQRDKHLRSPDFFDAARFPELKVVTRSVEIKGDQVVAKADLTIHGVTRPVTFTGEHYGVQKADFGQGPTLRSGYSLKAEIKRQDFGLNFNMLVEGVSAVGDKVTILIDAEIYRSLK